MKILLVDVDSKIPNVALMKISTYHKALEDTVYLVIGKRPSIFNADKIYISCVYKKNKVFVDNIISVIESDIEFSGTPCTIDVGGSGYDLKKVLPGYIEELRPDYSICPYNTASIGFASRGCFRRCGFCIVDKKEGKYRRAQHPSKWYNPEFKTITFLDNNILIDKEWFLEITDWCIKNNLTMFFSSGFDIRLIDSEIAQRLFEIRKHHTLSFAWDYIEDEAVIREKIALLEEAGFTSDVRRACVQFYVYVHNDAAYESGLYRCNELRKLNSNVFLMFNIDNKATRRIKDLRRWANRKWIFWGCEFKDYNKKDEKRVVETDSLDDWL